MSFNNIDPVKLYENQNQNKSTESLQEPFQGIPQDTSKMPPKTEDMRPKLKPVSRHRASGAAGGGSAADLDLATGEDAAQSTQRSTTTGSDSGIGWSTLDDADSSNNNIDQMQQALWGDVYDQDNLADPFNDVYNEIDNEAEPGNLVEPSNAQSQLIPGFDPDDEDVSDLHAKIEEYMKNPPEPWAGLEDVPYIEQDEEDAREEFAQQVRNAPWNNPNYEPNNGLLDFDDPFFDPNLTNEFNEVPIDPGLELPETDDTEAWMRAYQAEYGPQDGQRTGWLSIDPQSVEFDEEGRVILPDMTPSTAVPAIDPQLLALDNDSSMVMDRDGVAVMEQPDFGSRGKELAEEDLFDTSHPSYPGADLAQNVAVSGDGFLATDHIDQVLRGDGPSQQFAPSNEAAPPFPSLEEMDDEEYYGCSRPTSPMADLPQATSVSIPRLESESPVSEPADRDPASPQLPALETLPRKDEEEDAAMAALLESLEKVDLSKGIEHHHAQGSAGETPGQQPGHPAPLADFQEGASVFKTPEPIEQHNGQFSAGETPTQRLLVQAKELRVKNKLLVAVTLLSQFARVPESSIREAADCAMQAFQLARDFQVSQPLQARCVYYVGFAEAVLSKKDGRPLRPTSMSSPIDARRAEDMMPLDYFQDACLAKGVYNEGQWAEEWVNHLWKT